MNDFISHYFKLLLCFCLFLLYSCEYDNKEMNYHDVAPPEKNVIVHVNLAELPPSQVVYIYSETSLRYDINVSAGSIINKEFYLDGRLINSSDGQIFLSPYNVNSENSSKLTIRLKLTSGTGSLAELLGKETSEVEFSYPIKYVNPNFSLNISQRVNSQKQLELFWDKPIVEGADIESYTIYNYDSFNEVVVGKITSPDITTYVDKDYVYGSKTYKIVTKYKAEKVPTKEDYYTIVYKSFTEKMFSTSSSIPLKLKIKWVNPNEIAAKYVLKCQNELLYIDEGINETLIMRPAFPLEGPFHYELYILPIGADFRNYQRYAKVINYFQETFFDETLAQYVSSVRFAADVKNNSILAMRPNKDSFGFRSYSKDGLIITHKANLTVPYPYYTSTLQASPKTGKVAIHYRKDYAGHESKIYVYSDYTLKNLLNTFPTDDFPEYFLTDDDKLIISNNDRNLNRIYNVNTGQLLNSHGENVGTPFRPAMSSDGQYLINHLRVDKTWYKIYKYENDKLTLLKYQPNSEMKEIYFNPVKPNQVVMQTFKNNFSVYELPALNKLATVEGEFICFDTFTGNSLYQDKDYAYNSQLNILNATYDKTIYSIKTSSYYYYYTWLINNHLIIGDYYVNIVK